MASLYKRGARKESKRRHGQRKDFFIIGSMDFHNRDIIIVDDMIDTGTTLLNVVQQLRHVKPRRIFAVASHGVFSGEFRANIESSGITECIVTNSVLSEEHNENVVTLSIGKLLADTISRIHSGKPLKL